MSFLLRSIIRKKVLLGKSNVRYCSKIYPRFLIHPCFKCIQVERIEQKCYFQKLTY